MRRFSAVCLLLATTTVAAGDRDEFVVRSRPLELAIRDVGNGWREWQGLPLSTNERLSALYVTPADVDPAVRGVWLGTSAGWLYRGDGDTWTIEAGGIGAGITGIAIRRSEKPADPSGTVLLSTTDGVTSVGPFGSLHGATRTVKSIHNYYAQVPCVATFVFVDSDHERPMGFVDDILVRSARYSDSLAISGEHGILFNLGPVWLIDYHRSFYASERLTWFDPDAPIPHRRPTCVIEDRGGNLWVGTDGDGIVRINAETRFSHSPEEDRYFVRYSPEDIGCHFTRVTDAERGLDDSLWFILTDYGRRSYIARFHDDECTVVEIPQELGKTRRHGDELRRSPPVPFALAEVSPGRLLIGAENAGNLQLDWEARSFERVAEIEARLLEIEVSDDGAVWATTSNSLYQLTSPAR